MKYKYQAEGTGERNIRVFPNFWERIVEILGQAYKTTTYHLLKTTDEQFFDKRLSVLYGGIWSSYEK